MALIDSLNTLRDGLSIVGTSSQTIQIGTPFTAKIAPPLDGIQLTDTVDVPISFDLIAKGMIFSDGNIGDSTVLQPMPFINFTTVPPTTGTGVPGFIGRLTGQLPVPTQVPVNLDVEWSIRDTGGNTLGEGMDYTAPSGLIAPSVEVMFLPAFVELTTTTLNAPTVERRLHARVRLAAGGQTTGWRDLPELPLQVPGIAIPTVLVSFLNTNFTGAALVMVPESSPLVGISTLQDTLTRVYNLLQPLSSIARFASLVAGLDVLTTALRNEPRLVFQKKDQIGNLNDIDLITRGWFSNDTEAEDELSSMILVGPPLRAAECFNDRSFNDDEGKYTLVARQNLHALVRSLHPMPPTSGPVGDEITINKDPPGGWFDPDNFGDELSSIRFTTVER